MYDGPEAWLVRRNVLVACVALVPTFLEAVLLLSSLAGRLFGGGPLGDVVTIPGAIAALMLIPIGGAPYLAFFPFLLACLYLSLLLRSPEIPRPVKKRTFMLVTGALLIMFVTVILAYYLQYRGLKL